MQKKRSYKNYIIAALPFAIVIISLIAIVLVNIGTDIRPAHKYNFGVRTAAAVKYPNVSFATMSDLHYYDKSLGTNGTAFLRCLDSDRKLLLNSGGLLNFAINKISGSGVKFVLVTGDLTKDGELVDHLHVAAALSALVKQGIKVYVIPGNHDINNPGAFKYTGKKAVAVASVSAARFAQIYRGCGYGSAIMRDPSSLSYVAQPVKGLWIVGLDTCRYSENKKGGTEVSSGRLTQKEETWLEGVLSKARAGGDAVIVMSHHGIIEHWKGESVYSGNYLLQDYKNVGRLLASYDVRLAFTGHFHAQDITGADFGQYGKLYDIETGSLITPPCAVRFCTVLNNTLTVRSDHLIDEIYPDTDFKEKSIAFVTTSTYNAFMGRLQRYHVSISDADYIARAVAAAYNAHYNGDENESDRPVFDESSLSPAGKRAYEFEKPIIDGLWHDLPPSDNNCVIPLGA